MKLLRRLDVRLLLSYVGVIGATLAVMTVTLQLLAPSEFEAQVATIGQQYGFGRQATPETTDSTGSSGSTDPTVDQTGDSTSVSDGSTPTTPATTSGMGPGNDGSGPGGPGGTGGTGGSGGDAARRSGDGGTRSHGAEALNLTEFEAAQQGPREVGGTETIVIDLENAFDDALNKGLWIALLASLVLATALAALTSRRILRPLRNVQAATRRLADGRYDERVPVPREVELAELATDVNALGDTLARTEQQRSRLMSDLAHELRTPLTTIQGYMEGLIDGVFEPTPEVYLEVAEEATRLKRLTADLALLSRAEEGALVLDLQHADLGEVAARAAERLRPQFLDKEVELSIGPAPDLPIHGDADRLAQAFTNIVGNALVHTPEGGRVWLTASCDEVSCEVSVHDTGEGIPPDELEQIFERFHRVEGEGMASAGSGIGLTISRTIVRSHDGELTVGSAGPGRGSTFTIRLPRADR
jgi:histidine kinase